jgi:hypothetical protein
MVSEERVTRTWVLEAAFGLRMHMNRLKSTVVLVVALRRMGRAQMVGIGVLGAVE